MASERYSQPSNPRSPKAILVTTLLAHPQPLSTAQPSRKNHHFPQPIPALSHTCTFAHIIRSARKVPRDPGPISALSHQAKLYHAYAQQDVPSREKSQWMQHDIIKKGVDTYTFSHRQLLTWFSGEENWEARGRRGKLFCLCLFVPLELCEYLIYSKCIELKFRKREIFKGKINPINLIEK